MARQIKIARDGQEIGAWPFDVVFALVRCGSLIPTDTCWVDGMDDWTPLSEILPPSPSHIQSATFLGRADDEMGWMFYCRDGTTVIGPRPVDEVIALIFLNMLSDDNLLFIVGSERWISVADFMRSIETETPGTIDLCQRIRILAQSFESSSPTNIDDESQDKDWLQTGLNLTTFSPHIGGAYLGYHAVKRFNRWLKNSNGTNE